ncbi:FAD-dependent oxidoreductase [Gluconacetobacter sacchari]|uniref:FAD-dependent oxidoreductase n=2 Tax=Gluconacetobacter sacchari TaxID=92759 RepID=A0A7W4IFI2_9PROT|nr:FAD-dependent oxidoreductase [Gluconacetobacter sacchari]
MPLAVIGAGAVGVTTALHLRRLGHDVTLLSTDAPGSENATSYGNAGWLSPGSVVPISMPGMWKKVPGYLLNARGPLRLRPASLPHIWLWLLRFVACGATPARARAIASALRPFLADAPERHARLAAEAGVPDLIQRTGLVIVYPDAAAYEADAFGWQLRRENGVRWRTLDRAALEAACPGLGPQYGFGALLPDGAHCADPGGYVAALAALARERGVRFAAGHVDGFVVEAGQVRGVRTAGGVVACGGVVIAAGMGARALGATLGDTIPLVGERGYHVQLPGVTDEPAIPVMMSDLKFGITPMTGGLRAAGQVEFAPDGAPPDWNRARILLDCLREGLPMMKIGGFGTVRHWMGNRPSTPDCLPVIGPSPTTRGVFYATGHGHLGLVSAPWTADLIGRLVIGAPVPEAAPYDPARFLRFRL